MNTLEAAIAGALTFAEEVYGSHLFPSTAEKASAWAFVLEGQVTAEEVVEGMRLHARLDPQTPPTPGHIVRRAKGWAETRRTQRTDAHLNPIPGSFETIWVGFAGDGTLRAAWNDRGDRIDPRDGRVLVEYHRADHASLPPDHPLQLRASNDDLGAALVDLGMGF